MPGRRGLLVATVGVPLAAMLVLLIEIGLARRGPMLSDGALELGGRVGQGPGPVLQVAWLGDSTAAGVGAAQPASALPVRVAAGLDRPVELTVLARSGATVGDVVEDQLPDLAGIDPDTVFVSVGANDVTHLSSLSDVEGAYRKLLDGVPDGAAVVVLGIPDMGAIPRLAQPLRSVVGFRGRQLDEVVRAVAAGAGVAYVDIAGETGLHFRSDPERFFAADRYHPSAAGYGRWAEAVLDVVRGSAMLDR